MCVGVVCGVVWCGAVVMCAWADGGGGWGRGEGGGGGGGVFSSNPNCHQQSPCTFPRCLLKTNNKPVADINGRDEKAGSRSAGNQPQSALHLLQHLSLSIIWLLSPQINQITAPGLCAQLRLLHSLVALALKCMRSTFYHCYLFNAAFSPASRFTIAAKLNH